MFVFLDYLFFLAHCLLIGFNLLGWIWTKTRKIHLVVALLTGLSWTVLGIWYGFGYCPLTDWHWEVKRTLGEDDLPNSFIKYLADKLTGADINPLAIDIATGIGYLSALILSIVLNARKYLKSKF